MAREQFERQRSEDRRRSKDQYIGGAS
jgi:hypothetical protein